MVELSRSQKLLYALIKVNNGVGHKVAVAKLQYLADFIHYAFTSSPISDESIVYTRQDHGPLARTLTDDIEYMKELNIISEDKNWKYKALKDIPLDFSVKELHTIHFVLNKYGNMSWQDLRRISHDQAPYLSTEPSGIVEFFTAYNLIDEYPDYEKAD